MAFSPIKHNFTIKSTFIDYKTGEAQESFGDCISSVAIKKNFKSQVFPLYVVSINITKEQREYLAKNKFYLSLKIYTCEETATNTEDGMVESENPTTDKLVHNIILRPFDNTKLIPIIKTSEVSDETEIIKQKYEEYTINCVPKEQLQINNTIINACYEQANLNEIMINMISDVYTKDIYFQESSNITRYNSLLIPPMSLLQALKYLQEYYVIYSQNLNMFFEDSKFYIYDMYNLSRKFNNYFYIDIPEIQDSDQTKYRTNYVDENNNVKVYLENNPLFMSTTDIYRYTSGEKIVFNSYDDNFNLVSRTYNLNETGNTGNDIKTRYKWNENKKQDYETRDLNSVFLHTQHQLRNIDPTYFAPDTMISITGKSEQINGQYALIEMDEYYSTSDYKNFNNTIILNLGRIDQ